MENLWFSSDFGAQKSTQDLSRILFLSISVNFVKFQETCGKVLGTASFEKQTFVNCH